MATDRTIAKVLRGSILASNGDIVAPATVVQDENSRVVVVPGLDADEAMASTASSAIIYRTHVAIRILAVRVLPTGGTGVTAGDTNYATVAVSKNDDAGGTKTVVASQTTKITGGSGNWTAEQSVLLTLSTVAGAIDLTAGQALHLVTTKAASGVVVPKCRVYIRYEEI